MVFRALARSLFTPTPGFSPENHTLASYQKK